MGYPNVRLNTAELAPTQATIGGFEVLLKADRFKLMSPSAIRGYLQDKADKGKPVQVVKGLHRYFIVDGHHTLSAIMTASKPRQLDLALREDFSNVKTDEKFWRKMEDAGFFYDRCLGAGVSPADFPDDLADLVDDPFRSIAWIVRKMGAYDDLKMPYQEFRIADFLREHSSFAPMAYHEFETACLRGYELMRSDLAGKWAKRHQLPGLKTGGKAPEDLVEIYYDVLTAARAPRYYHDG